MRGCGILMPISSLASRFGIGCISKEAYEFVDFLSKAGQGYWQILPVGPTGFGDSPYQPFSAFAGNPYFICLEDLIEKGLLTWDEVNSRDFGSDEERVDYGALYNNRFDVLRIAYGRFLEKKMDQEADYAEFTAREQFWLEDYALFMALKELHEGKGWSDWDDEYRLRKPQALKKAKEELKETIGFFEFQQFMFDQQWRALKKYANKHNVRIIGDIPFYVALDSTDAWSHPEAFLMDKDLKPTVVAGCLPDAFSATGQLWGNPIYDWPHLKKRDYDWWVKRIRRSYELYDVIRIDHFHGFSEYCAIPYGDETALNGKMCKGPGIDFFRKTAEQVPEMREEGLHMIAEDLGNNTEEKEKLLKDSGLPGMKVLQFAFTSWDSAYLTHRHERNFVVYTGTHDNTTARAWVEELNEGARSYVRRYINSVNTDYGAFVWDFIREAYRSVAELCIIPLQDYLVKGKEARINSPGVADGNWQWRLKPHFLSDDLARSIYGLSELYGRLPQEEPVTEEPEETEETEETGKTKQAEETQN